MVNSWSYAISLGSLNSSLNPILYYWKLEEVRQEVKNTIRQVLCHCFSSFDRSMVTVSNILLLLKLKQNFSNENLIKAVNKEIKTINCNFSLYRPHYKEFKFISIKISACFLQNTVRKQRDLGEMIEQF